MNQAHILVYDLLPHCQKYSFQVSDEYSVFVIRVIAFNRLSKFCSIVAYLAFWVRTSTTLGFFTKPFTLHNDLLLPSDNASPIGILVLNM